LPFANDGVDKRVDDHETPVELYYSILESEAVPGELIDRMVEIVREFADKSARVNFHSLWIDPDTQLEDKGECLKNNQNHNPILSGKKKIDHSCDAPDGATQPSIQEGEENKGSIVPMTKLEKFKISLGTHLPSCLSPKQRDVIINTIIDPIIREWQVLSPQSSPTSPSSPRSDVDL